MDHVENDHAVYTTDLSAPFASTSFCHLPKIFRHSYISVPKIPLNEDCEPKDVCKDEFAECNRQQNKCLCKPGYFDRGLRCSKSSSFHFLAYNYDNFTCLISTFFV